jgi:hypothetical protein
MKFKFLLHGRHFLLSAIAATVGLAAGAESVLRPPSVPLVACDPYFSIWSPADQLNGADTVHWTGKPHRLSSLVRIDGQVFRLMGQEPHQVPALSQTSVEVLPTRTIYSFEGQGVRLTLTFMTPALPDDLMVYSRPVTYVTWDLKALDGRDHSAQVYFDASGELTVTERTQVLMGTVERIRGLSTLKMGSKDQAVLGKKGDDLRIDWGYLYLASKQAAVASLGAPEGLRQGFLAGTQKAVSPEEVPLEGKPARQLAASISMDFGKVGTRPVSRWLILAYDDQYSIQYFKKNLRPYWRRKGDDAVALLRKSVAEYDSLRRRCERFDAELMDDLRRSGGDQYARICALTYRECIAGTKLVADAKGQPLLFPKENTSNGCIGTVDVIYPMAPQFLLFGPSLTKAMLVPNLDYGSSPRWKWPFAPHDLGTYPLANAQVYGGGERTEEDQMPVEETGNMLILVAALAQMERNADFAAQYWPTLTKWAEYLKDKGFDPENQLCTDDFMGHLAHNVNLSIKATLGIASYAYLCELRGEKDAAAKYHQLAADFARRWVIEADDGDHFRLAFDKPGTWSQKYNLVWDKILGFGLYSDSVRRKEMDYYLKIKKTFGVPLDNRGDGAKLDWSLWTATLTRNRSDFEAVLNPVYRFLNETPERVGAGDFYNTATGHHISMHSRPVVGGVFLEVLYDRALWRKWWSRDKAHAANWAPLPVPPKIVTVAAAADREAATWRFTTNRPPVGWTAPAFDDGAWLSGRSGFGTAGTPGAVIGTVWNTSDIWLRRELHLTTGNWHNLQAWLHHDEDAEVYINGTVALKITGYTSAYDTVPLLPAGKAAVKEGKNIVAIHCHQTTGGQYIDLGFVEVEEPSMPIHLERSK